MKEMFYIGEVWLVFGVITGLVSLFIAPQGVQYHPTYGPLGAGCIVFGIMLIWISGLHEKKQRTTGHKTN